MDTLFDPIVVGGESKQETILDRDVKNYWLDPKKAVSATPEELPTKNVNPCVTKFGPGPEGEICQNCIHLHGFRQSATWYKCDLRQWKSKGGKNRGTIYPGGDHRVRWPACAKFEKRENDPTEVGGNV